MRKYNRADKWLSRLPARLHLTVMRKLWNASWRVFEWCEDRRPGGGFTLESIHTLRSSIVEDRPCS